jgi:glutamate synthase domain-containing protein 1
MFRLNWISIVNILCRVKNVCGIVGILNELGEVISGKMVIQATNAMEYRYNGLGGGFAGYGIYPKHKEFYALHILFLNEERKNEVEEILSENVKIIHDEEIPTRKASPLSSNYIPWRYFVDPLNATLENSDDAIIELVMHIGGKVKDVAVLSSGKNMGVFKATGYPREVADLFKIDEYKAYLWIGHGRYPTNTPGWWGGAHPFNILDWSVVHNGEISSYDTNRRFLKMWGYDCNLLTDTEVIAYVFDLLVRKHGLPLKLAAYAMAPPFWEQIDRLKENEMKTIKAIRMVYGSALLNGPFSIVVGRSNAMIGMTDRIKLRPLIAAKKGEMNFLSSEESSIRSICSEPDVIWAPKAGDPVVSTVGGK